MGYFGDLVLLFDLRVWCLSGLFWRWVLFMGLRLADFWLWVGCDLGGKLV